MLPLVTAVKSREGGYLPQNFRSSLEKVRYQELLKPRQLEVSDRSIRIRDLTYEPGYEFMINGIAVASYRPDFVYEEETYVLSEVHTQEAADPLSLDGFEIIEQTLSKKRVAEDVKGTIIEPHSILKMQILVALNSEIDEGRIVVAGSKASRVVETFTKEQFIIDPNSNNLTQIANTSLNESERISEIKQILSRLPPYVTSSNFREMLKDSNRAHQLANYRIVSLNSSVQLWLDALQSAKNNGLVKNFWLKPRIYPDLGNTRIFLEPYVPFCIYETRKGELVLMDVKHTGITKEDWIRLNVTKVLLKDVIKIFKVYFNTILIEEWSRDLTEKMGVKPKDPPKVNPYWDLSRVSFWDSSS